jgi:hypothetical protein
VTICVRTPELDAWRPQLDYAPPSVAFDPFASDAVLRRTIGLLSAAIEADHAGGLACFDEWLTRARPYESFIALLWLVPKLGLEALAGRMEALAKNRAIDDEAREAFERAAREHVRRAGYRGLRTLSRSPEHRLLLAGQLAFASRAPLLAWLNAHRLAEGTAKERALATIAEVQAAAGDDAAPWGLPIGKVEHAVLAALLDGDDDATVESRVLAGPHPPRRDEIRLACALLRHAPLLAPLTDAVPSSDVASR